MNDAMRLILVLMASLWLQPASGGDAIEDTFEECIEEPIFEGRVCTIQANRKAGIGVVLIHGLGGSVEQDWMKTIPALSANFHVVAFDLPGFGKSDKGSQHYSPTNYARLARFLADRYLPDKPYHVVGHSLGGAVALRFAAQRPMRFQRLVLIDAAGILHPVAITKFQAGSMMERASGLPQMRGITERLSGKILEQADRLPIKPTDIVDTVLGRDHVLQGGPKKIAALALAGENFTYAISSVSAPTLIVWGDNDLIAPLRTGKVLAARMPHARMEIIASSGHEPMQDQTETLNTLIRNHLLASDAALSEHYKQAPPRPALASKRTGACKNESGKVFEGDYRAIELHDCSNVTIRNARVGQMSVINSRLYMIDTDILGNGIAGNEAGLLADNSDITITNGDISGTIAINSANSRLDLAGVHLKGAQSAIKGVNSKFTFSVSRMSGPDTISNLHTFKNMSDEEL